MCFLGLFLSLFFLFCLLSQLLVGQIAKTVSHSDLFFYLTAWYSRDVPWCCWGCQRKTITIIALDYFKLRAAANPRREDCSAALTALRFKTHPWSHAGAQRNTAAQQKTLCDPEKNPPQNISGMPKMFICILMRSCYNWANKSDEPDLNVTITLTASVKLLSLLPA